MVKCHLCHNLYGQWRDHCPTCGNFQLLGMTLHIDCSPENRILENKFYSIVAAKGCERQYATHARVFLDFSSCDAESEFGLRLD